MATTTAGALIAAGLRRAEMLDSPNGYIKHPAAGGGEAFDYLNAALAELFDLLYEAQESAHSFTSLPWATVNGTASYAISALTSTSFYHLLDVTYFDGFKNVPLSRVNVADRNKYPLPGIPRGYAIEGDNIEIFPKPNAAYTMGVVFESLPPETSADTDSLDLKGPHKEFVWKHFARQCLDKQESDTTALRIDLYGPQLDGKGGLAQRIRETAKKRDAARPTRPVDVMGDDDGMSALPPFAKWTG